MSDAVTADHDQPARISVRCLAEDCANCWNDDCACPYCGHPGAGKQAA